MLTSAGAVLVLGPSRRVKVFSLHLMMQNDGTYPVSVVIVFTGIFLLLLTVGERLAKTNEPMGELKLGRHTSKKNNLFSPNVTKSISC